MKKILIVCLDNLGDAIMASAVFRPLRILFPGCEIGFWVKEYTANAFVDQSLVDVVHASDPFWDRSPGESKGGKIKFLMVLNAIRQKKYDMAFVLNTDWRRSLAVWLAGIPKRYGYNRKKSGPLLTQPTPLNPTPGGPIDFHRHLIQSVIGTTVSDEHWVPRLDLTREEKKWGHQWVQQHNWENKPILVFHPLTGDPVKCWPLSNWVDLVHKLKRKDKDYRFVFICSPAECADLKEKMKFILGERCQILSSSLSHLKGLISESDIVIGGDSGPGHMASALGKPVLSLFGPTNPQQFSPRGHGAVKVLKKNPLSELSVKTVVDEISIFYKNELKRPSGLKV